jgi:two-component system, chemotaxis family, protein-glutamate methylesterase/glutaminase
MARPMGRPRVLVVDDSVVARRLVSKAITADDAVEVVGAAADGRVAVAQIERLHPDVVTLDLDMPVMDGLETVEAIRERWPHLAVIMVSTYTVRGAQVTLDALALGANDYVVKPSGSASPTEAMTRLRDELVPRILALCPHPTAGRQTEHRAAEAIATAPTGPEARIDAVAIAVSTGGPTALGTLLATLPANLPVPVLIVQHMPPVFTRVLAERLDRTCAIHVLEAADGHAVEPGTVRIAPGDRHMVVERTDAGVRVRTTTAPRENSCRPSADPLFRSLADTYGAHTLGVVMTGMGSDGLRGARRIVEAGGRVIVQDEATSVVWGMPGFVAREGLADAVVPLDDLPGAIGARLRTGRVSASTLRPVGVAP